MTQEKAIGMDSGSPYNPLRVGEVDPQIIVAVGKFLEQVPDLPVHVHKILKIVSDIESDSKEIVKLASSDPVMASKILSVVNSAFFGLRRKIDDLHLAIVLLGYREIRKMAIQIGFSTALKCAYDTRGLWEHSYLVSLCAESIPPPGDRERAGVLMTVGILHDIGKFVLDNPALSSNLRRMSQASGEAAAGSSTVEREDVSFGINHAVIGKILAEKWNLSDTICEALEFHHHPSFYPPAMVPSENLNIIASTCLADVMVNHITGASPYRVPGRKWFDLAGVGYPLEENIAPALLEKLEKAKKFLLYIE